ncbi:MAG: homogentisate 1,2-dioxygenase [Bdellovibrio sp.]|nr:MAG: homogentisate 1,2-dioxygenase [Bdellovibrio sp.]
MIPYQKGTITRQAHVSLPDGLVEEEYGREGFFGPYTHFYRTAPPVNWTHIEGPLRPHSLDCNQLEKTKTSDFITGRQTLLYNQDVQIQFLYLDTPMPYLFRNADGDDLFFVHKGQGKMETDFGPFQYKKGDYLVIPRGTVYRLFPKEPSAFLVVESKGAFRLPEKGLLGQQALFDPAIINVPDPEPLSYPPGEYHLKIKRLNEITTVTYPFYPINVVGWKGTLAPWQINVADIRPVSCERYHLPPSAHTTFVSRNFVVCSFLPRPLETGDPTALKVPFYHSNIDYDEVLFYHEGEFFSRTGIGKGMITFHPQGLHHGPQPGAFERTKNAARTNEVAVMIDTRHPLFMSDQAQEIENKDYWKSWREKDE